MQWQYQGPVRETVGRTLCASCTTVHVSVVFATNDLACSGEGEAQVLLWIHVGFHRLVEGGVWFPSKMVNASDEIAVLGTF